jgi:hypothetical protein
VWLKVKALSSSPSTAKKKKKKPQSLACTPFFAWDFELYFVVWLKIFGPYTFCISYAKLTGSRWSIMNNYNHKALTPCHNK